MRKIDENGLMACKFVSNLFEYSTKKAECSSSIFIKAYVHSSIPKRIASKSFILESFDVAAAYETIKQEKVLTSGKEIYPSFVMAWIGYILKYFSCVTLIPEKIIYKHIKPKELYKLYEAYHSLDNDLVVKRIAEAKNININFSNIEIMRSLK